MYSTDKLTTLIDDYMDECKGRVTKTGLARKLNLSTNTIYNVLSGRYNGLLYGLHPQYNRAIDNSDFSLIRSVFGVKSCE